MMKWWSGGGSNSRPLHCERSALPAELPPHVWRRIIARGVGRAKPRNWIRSTVISVWRSHRNDVTVGNAISNLLGAQRLVIVTVVIRTLRKFVSSKMFQTIFSTVLPIVFGISGLHDLWVGYVAFVAARRSERWQFVYGKVRSAQVAESSMVGEPGVRPDIVYEYAVDGKQFTGKLIAFGLRDNFFSGIGFAQKYIDSYPAGSRVRVYYDPLFPSSAVLKPGLSFWTFVSTLFGIGTFVVIYILFVVNTPGF
jgi:hypothetical protein